MSAFHFCLLFLQSGLPVATETSELVPGDCSPGDFFGRSVAIDGDTTVVGASRDDTALGIDSGSAYVFVDGVQVAWLTASDGAPSAVFGSSVSLCADTLVVGAIWDGAGGPGAGAAYVFERDQGGAGAWGEVVKLTASDGSSLDYFGHSLSIDGDTVVVGAWAADGNVVDAGAVYVYERDAGGADAWGETAKLVHPTSAVGDRFGRSVAVAGDTLVAGAPRDDPNGPDTGSALVFVRSGGSWSVQRILSGPPESWNDAFGQSVNLEADTVVVGTQGAQGTATSALVFERDLGGAGAWGELQELAVAEPTVGWFRVAISGSLIALGNPNQAGAGATYVFERGPGTSEPWFPISKLTASTAAQGDLFGYSVAASAGVVVVGAKRSDNCGADSGAAFLFDTAPSVFSSFCTAGTSASGCSANLTAGGTPSATSASGFDLVATSVEGAKDGVFYWGANGRLASPWGNGSSTQCVAPPVARGDPLAGTGLPGTCGGVFVQDLNAQWSSNPAKSPGVGATVQAQLWYRDPLNTSNRSTSLSDALELIVRP